MDCINWIVEHHTEWRHSSRCSAFQLIQMNPLFYLLCRRRSTLVLRGTSIPSEVISLIYHEKYFIPPRTTVCKFRSPNDMGSNVGWPQDYTGKTGPLTRYGSFISRIFLEYFLKISTPRKTFPYHGNEQNCRNWIFQPFSIIFPLRSNFSSARLREYRCSNP